jgi:hypothetical protein
LQILDEETIEMHFESCWCGRAAAWSSAALTRRFFAFFPLSKFQMWKSCEAQSLYNRLIAFIYVDHGGHLGPRPRKSEIPRKSKKRFQGLAFKNNKTLHTGIYGIGLQEKTSKGLKFQPSGSQLKQWIGLGMPIHDTNNTATVNKPKPDVDRELGNP